MANRVVDYQATSARKSTSPLEGFDFSSWKSADIKKYLGSLEELVLKYPGPALASAFMVGVLVAWWIKRK